MFAFQGLAQVHTIPFSVTDPGVSKAITNWGLDTCWTDVNNMKRGQIYMGSNNVNLVRVGFLTDQQLTNNDISTSQKATLQSMADIAALAPNARWDMNLSSSVGSWFISGANTVYPDRWALAIEAAQRYYNKTIWSVEGFNEPDLTSNNEGSAANLYSIFGYLQASTNFPSATMAGGSTLNNDNALSWFNTVAARAKIGTTHCLAGTVSTYVGFIQNVVASNAAPYNPELHNSMEAILGVEYGLQGGIWWYTAELTRGAFVKACQGKRLGYSDDWANWNAAAVYRGTNGTVQAFVGNSERMAYTTPYSFISKDRAVFFDGNGPQRAFSVTLPGGTGYQAGQLNLEKMVNIAWGADVQPVIGGRYMIVNRNSGLVLDVPGATTNWVTGLDQATYTGGSNQLWDIYPLSTNFGGDMAYFTMLAAHSGAAADDNNYSYDDNNSIIQYGTAGSINEHWYFCYTNNGYFKIRNRWSGKCLSVYGSSTSSGAAVVQRADTGALDQQWRLVPASATTYDFTAPAAPTGLTALANPASVQLSWTANTESDLASYTVLRSTTSGSAYEIVARGLTSPFFSDGSVQPGTTYYYVVAATDKSLNQSSYSSQVSASRAGGQTMLANYNFESSTADGSVNGNDAELVNGGTYATGKYGSALSLSGANNQSVLVPPGILAGVTNFTIATWVYWNGGNAWQRIFDFGNGTSQYMFLSPSSGSGTLRFAVTTNGSGSEVQLNAGALPTGRWVHVAVVRSGTTNYLYTNLVLAASGSSAISPGAFNPTVNYLGQSQFNGDPTFKGMLDSVYILNYALTKAQLTNVANTSFPSGFTYQIVNRADGKALDNYGYTTNASGVYQYTIGPSSNQRWTINASGSNYKLQCVTGGLCLDTGGLSTNGAPLMQYASGSSGNQLWNFAPAGSGYYYITNLVTGKAVDTLGQTANGAQMTQYGLGGSWNQLWKVLGF